MTGNIDRVEVITSVQRRRRWSAEEKARIVQETYAPGMSVSLVARQHGVAPNQVFTCRRLYAEGALSAVAAGEEVVPASDTELCSTRSANCSGCSARKPSRTKFCGRRSTWRIQKNGCCGHPCPRGTARREDRRRYPRHHPLQSGRTSDASGAGGGEVVAHTPRRSLSPRSRR